MPCKKYQTIGPWTINNPTENDFSHVRTAVADGYCKYVVFCHENKDREGHTYHLQGYASGHKPYSIRKWHEVLGPRFSVAPDFNGVYDHPACIAYCKGIKDGQSKDGSGEVEEFGSLNQGKRNDIEEAVKKLENNVPLVDIIKEDPPLCKFVRNLEWVQREFKRKREREEVLEELQDFKPYEYQQAVLDLVETPANDRDIHWFWESTGNIGKSKLTKYLLAHGIAYCPKVSKIQDIMYAYNGEKAVVFDIPRSKQEHMDHVYAAIEDFKDGKIFVSKYESHTRIFKSPHVIVFANFPPNLANLSPDRWKVHDLNREVLRPGSGVKKRIKT